jgi:uncharacterized membrane protein SirB2
MKSQIRVGLFSLRKVLKVRKPRAAARRVRKLRRLISTMLARRSLLLMMRTSISSTAKQVYGLDSVASTHHWVCILRF